MTEQHENKWSTYGFRILINTVSHPFEYAKVLIQIGYEPIPPKPSTTFFGKPALKLPNIFQYVKHIKTVDGFTGCYRGLESKACGSILSAIATQKVTDYLEMNRNDEDDDELDVELLKRKRFIRNTRNDIVTRATAIIVSQPFHVITVRIMAQFIGREVKYRGIFGSIGEIYKQNGLLGFFSGLIPRLLGDILTVLVANTLTYVINTYIVEEKELQVYTSATMMFIATAVTYPFQVVSNCMAVSKSGLMAGSPPFMPHYGTWVNCWTDLSNRNQLKRGSSLLVRYYVGPQFSVDSKMMPKMSSLKY
ncbi:mitochondrial carrier homolog 2 [Harmonia axyridis]|uniref:mitochondrial carrier homolog 2 n=1 Tax=Harmonia axyridis TaxID=115357 RepID=UPI001E277DFC|nr:mitochondrial carrier homolog 2 [Harmonia axyridis]